MIGGAATFSFGSWLIIAAWFKSWSITIIDGWFMSGQPSCEDLLHHTDITIA
jgi:hypothetical protein